MLKPATPSREVIARALADFRVAVSDVQAAQIHRYMEMLMTWNEKINLTAIRDPLEMLYRHFGESMFAAAVVAVEKGRLADVGSGGGFPGLPLKILSPELQVFLVESNTKKAVFLAEVIRELRLGDTKVVVSRYESLAEELAPLDFVSARALGQLDMFLTWASSPAIAAKQVILWVSGRDLDMVRRLGGWEWQEPVAIPQSLQRFLLTGTRRQEA